MNPSSFLKMSSEFTVWLKGKGFAKRTAAQYGRELGHFLSWLADQNMESTDVVYRDVLGYMQHCRRQGASQNKVQKVVSLLRHYYAYLGESGQATGTPAQNIKVQGVKRRNLYRPLAAEELHKLYNSFTANTLQERRDKALLGLLVYQGLSSRDVGLLKVEHIKLREGVISLPGSKQTEGRELKLEPQQIMELYDYVQTVRKEILNSAGCADPGTLFINMGGSAQTRRVVQSVMEKVKQASPEVKNVQHLRSSVITKWLRLYNLRKAQYMAGHRFVTSTEAYLQNEMEGLSEEVNKYHPLG